MSGNTNNVLCNQISKNLPLKKRRTYFIDSLTANDEQDENHSKTKKQSYSRNDSFQNHISSLPTVPTPPASPHIELLRQQYAYLLANSTNIPQENYLLPSTYNYLVTQQFLENYRTLLEQQQQHDYTIIEDKQKRTAPTIDEHFRKSLGDNYNKFTSRCLTPDESTSIEQTSVNSIEEHFARSLAKFRSFNNDASSSSNEVEKSIVDHQITESVVDDHFAKALGSTTWEKLKEKS